MTGLPNLASDDECYGVVAIGRNEGERLRECLASLDPAVAPLVYVDSGSTDGSIATAKAAGASVVALDMTTPFTAARARNAGFAQLRVVKPEVAYVQFVDGDCEVDPGWIAFACAFLDAHPRHVAVAGLRRERHPEQSVYNAICDIDWASRPGDTTAFGGDVMLRAVPFAELGGYDPTLIAGEEPELSIRLRRLGWKIRQTDQPMTLHDAQILRFGQWWKRSVRSGYAYAQGAAMYGAAPERHWVRERNRAVAWGLVLPATALAAGLVLHPLGLALLTAYPLQVVRLYLKSPLPKRMAAALAVFRVIGRFAEVTGVLKFMASRRRADPARLIEYK